MRERTEEGLARVSEVVIPDFRTLFESTPGLYLVLAPDLRIAAVSDAYAEATMTKREEILGRGLFDVFPDNPDDPVADGVSNLRASLASVLRNRKTHTMAVQKYDIRRPDGTFEMRYWSPINKPVFDAHNEIVYIIHRVEDVTAFVELQNRERQKDKVTAELQRKVEEMELDIFKRWEQMVRERTDQLVWAEKRLQLALAAGELGDWRWDAKTDLMTLSPKAAEIFGLPLEPNTWANLRYVLHEDDRERARQTVERALASHTDYKIEYQVVHPDGSICWVSTRARGIYGKNGEVLGMTGIAQDITERKRAEEALRQSEERSRAFLSATSDVVYSMSPDWSEMRYLEGKEFIANTTDPSRNWLEKYIHPDDQPQVLAVIGEAIRTKNIFELEHRVIRADGSMGWTFSRAIPILDARGDIIEWFGAAKDITERKRAEEALREETHYLEVLNKTGMMLASKLELQTLLQTITDAVTDLSGAKFGAFFYNSIDDKGEKYLLYTLSGAPREAFEKFGHPRATPLFAPTFRGEDIIRLDDVLKDPRFGQWGPHHGMPPGHLPVRSYLAVPVVSRSGEVIGGLFFGHPKPGVFTARSERLVANIAAHAAVAIDNARLYEASQNATENERAARAETERISELKDEFLANLSHELRTPLSAILGWTQLLRHRSFDVTHIRKGLEIIERNTRLQVQLIDDLLDMSRITSGKLRLDVQLVEPTSFIEAALETVKLDAEAKDIRIEKILDTAPRIIHGDSSRLQQVMWNLLSNAIKFTPKQGKVQVLLAQVNSHIEISVTDTGIGLKPEFLEHVFERFRQADGSTTREYGGLGLGLSIVKHLVELHGGTVLAESRGEGQGAIFTIRLPLADLFGKTQSQEQHHLKTTLPAIPDLEPNLSGIKVLVVDNEDDGRELIKQILEDANADVITAEGGKEALAILEKCKVDILVSDIGMPEMDGYGLIKHVRAFEQRTGQRIPAIALTAFARPEDRTRALRAGFLMHFAKPVESDELLATVASAAGRVVS